MMITPITLLYSGILSLFFVTLSLLTIKKRRKHKITFGCGGEKSLEARVRAHGNFAEYIPFLLLFMLLAELNHVSTLWLHLFGVAIVIGRIIHIYGLNVLETRTPSNTKGRFFGTLITLILLLVSGTLCIAAFLYNLL